MVDEESLLERLIRLPPSAVALRAMADKSHRDRPYVWTDD
jgi:hypothetical protein